MTSKQILTITLCFLGSTFATGQSQAPQLPPAPANPPAPSLQATADPGYADLVAKCKTPPPARGARGGGGAAAGARGAAGAGAAGGAGARGAQAPAGPRDVTVTEIPGVIAAGQQWKFIWQEAGNNGDGIVGTDDGALLLAQSDTSNVLKLARDGIGGLAGAGGNAGA